MNGLWTYNELFDLLLDHYIICKIAARVSRTKAVLFCPITAFETAEDAKQRYNELLKEQGYTKHNLIIIDTHKDGGSQNPSDCAAFFRQFYNYKGGFK